MIDEKEYHWDKANATLMGEYLTKTEQRFINQAIDKRIPKRCLDIGGGSGRFAIPLSQKGVDMIVTEYDMVPIRKLLDKTSVIPVVRADGQHLPFLNEYFDCIMSIETWGFFADIPLFLSEAKRVLSARGKLMVTAENSGSYKNILRKIVGGRDTAFYRQNFNEIKKMIQDAGFEIKTCFGYNWIPVGRASNSIIVPIFSFVEKILKLKYVSQYSPWVFIVAQKKR